MKINGCGQAKILAEEEVEALFAKGLKCQRDRTLFDICYCTACRAGEARQLKLSDVFDGEKIREKITIRKVTTKGKQATREIPTHYKLRQSLEAYLYQSAELLEIHERVGDWDIKSALYGNNVGPDGKLACPKCKGQSFSTAGKSRGKQILKCRGCGYRFQEKTAFWDDPDLKAKVIELGVFNSYSFGFLDLASPNPYLFPGSTGKGFIGRTTVKEIFTDACDRIDLVGAGTHSFRRTALTKMHDAGIPLRVIQQISGHSKLKNLQLYLEVKPRQVRAAVYQLYPLYDDSIYHYGRKRSAS